MAASPAYGLTLPDRRGTVQGSVGQPATLPNRRPPMRMAEPQWLWLLTLLPAPWLARRGRPRLAWPTLKAFDGGPRGLAAWRFLPPLLRSLALAAMAFALARPQTVGGTTTIRGRGVAIVVALDRSRSMATADFPGPGPPSTRLEAAQRTFARFARGRPNDLLGLVAFAAYPSLSCVPTADHAYLLEAATRLAPARPGDDGTNLGDAMAVGIDALVHSSPRKKVLILLTDGEDRPALGIDRPLDPRSAGRLAADLGVTVHAIAVGGTEGPDRPLLKAVAESAGGKLFEAADSDALAAVFDAIDRLEASPLQTTVRTRYDERYAPWAGLAAGLLALESTLTAGRLRRLP